MSVWPERGEVLEDDPFMETDQHEHQSATRNVALFPHRLTYTDFPLKPLVSPPAARREKHSLKLHWLHVQFSLFIICEIMMLSLQSL